jgi:hypothetical protein
MKIPKFFKRLENSLKLLNRNNQKSCSITLNNKPNNREKGHIIKISANLSKVKISKNLGNS